jgi:hypothetical protein
MNTSPAQSEPIALIPDDTLHSICKIGQGKACCRYVIAGPGGIECAKHTDLRNLLDKRVAAGTFVAQGDNCAGLKPTETVV